MQRSFGPGEFGNLMISALPCLRRLILTISFALFFTPKTVWFGNWTVK